MQATALGRYLLYGPDAQDARDRAARRRRAQRHARPRRRLARPGRERQVEAGQRADEPRARRQRGQPRRAGRAVARALELRREAGLRQVPGGRGQRQRHADQGRDPDVEGPRLLRRPHPPRRLRVPRRPLPLRPPVEPLRGDGRAARLRRPLPQRRRRGGRELHQHGQPGRHAQPRGLAVLRRLAARRVPDARGDLLEVARARLALRAAPDGQRPRREPRALRPVPAQEEQLQRDGERVQAGRGHAPAAGLHRRPVRRSRQGLLPPGEQLGRGPQGHQRRQARRRARHRGVSGTELRAVQRDAEVRRRPDRPGAQPAVRRRGAVAVPGAQVRQRSGRHALRLGRHRRARQHRQQVGHRPVLGRQPLRRRRPRQPAASRSATPRPSSSTRSSGRC